MATIKAINSRASIGRAVNYVTKEEKTEDKLITGKDCDPFHATDDMKHTKQLWGKTGGREYKHYVQSFHEKENITPEQAHKIACDLAEREFKGYEVLVATHTDKEHIHSHFIVNSVNFETGEKFRQSKKWLENFKAYSDELCRKNGLTVTEKGKSFEGKEREETSAYSKETYQFLKKAEKGEVKSYVQDVALAAYDCKEKATSREDFIQKMSEKGYKVDWENKRKNITFTDIAREKAGEKQCKVRDSRLEKYYNIEFGKESLEKSFQENLQKLRVPMGLYATDSQFEEFRSKMRNRGIHFYNGMKGKMADENGKHYYQFDLDKADVESVKDIIQDFNQKIASAKESEPKKELPKQKSEEPILNEHEIIKKIDSLSKGYIALKTECNRLQRDILSTDGLKGEMDTLNRLYRQYKESYVEYERAYDKLNSCKPWEFSKKKECKAEKDLAFSKGHIAINEMSSFGIKKPEFTMNKESVELIGEEIARKTREIQEIMSNRISYNQENRGRIANLQEQMKGKEKEIMSLQGKVKSPELQDIARIKAENRHGGRFSMNINDLEKEIEYDKKHLPESKNIKEIERSQSRNSGRRR